MDCKDFNWVFISASPAGQYLKYIDEENKYYYKLSDYYCGRFTSNESVMEVIASRVGRLLGLPVLRYTGEMSNVMLDNKVHTTFVAKSKNFVPSTSSSMPLHLFYQLNKLEKEQPYNFMVRMGWKEYVDALFVFDYLIIGVDRHGRNVEIIVSNNGVSKPAPIFDNGRSFTFEYGTNKVLLEKFDYTADFQANNFIGGISLERNLNYVDTVFRVPSLTNCFKRRVFYGLKCVLTEEHIELLWSIINYRYGLLKEKGIFHEVV